MIVLFKYFVFFLWMILFNCLWIVCLFWWMFCFMIFSLGEVLLVMCLFLLIVFFKWWFKIGIVISWFVYIYKCVNLILLLERLLMNWCNLFVVDNILEICVSFILFKFVLILICFIWGWIFLSFGIGILFCRCCIFNLFLVFWSYFVIVCFLFIGINFVSFFFFCVVIINCLIICLIFLNFNVLRIWLFILLFYFLLWKKGCVGYMLCSFFK